MAQLVLSVPVFYAILALGILNLVAGALVLFTCRCIPQFTGGRMLKRGWYARLFKYHNPFWVVFGASVVIHAVLAVTRFVFSI